MTPRPLRSIPFVSKILVTCWLSAGAAAQVVCNEFEVDADGWVATGIRSSWAWGQPAGSIIADAGRGTRSWVTNLTGNHNNGERSYLTSPVFDLRRLAADPEVRFLQNFRFDAFGDFATLELSLDGGPFTTLGSRQSGGTNWYSGFFNDSWTGTSQGWRAASHPLQGAAGHLAQVRFHLHADASAAAEGFAIDSFELVEPNPIDDVGVIEILAPRSGAGLGLEQVRVRVRNFGSAPQSGFRLTYRVDGAAIASEAWTGALAPGTTVDVTLVTPYDFSAVREYLLDVATVSAADTSPCNDALRTVIVHQPSISTLPYREGFENGDGGYYTGGTNSSWELGVPANSFIANAASGAIAWVTDLDGNFRTDEHSFLYSPPFDFSAVPAGADLTLEFAHLFSLGRGQNGHFLEVSLDRGPWIRVGATGEGLNWYTNPASQSWMSESWTTLPPQWRTAAHSIAMAAGHFAQFRFVLQWNPPLPPGEGAAIDDVTIRVDTQRLVSNFPYHENFELDDGGYVRRGTNVDWQIGRPTGLSITQAASGQNAWVTNLRGLFNGQQRSFLESPIFDFSQFAADTDARLVFSHQYDLGSTSSSVRHWLEVSFDGAPWRRLGAYGTGTNWYGDFNNDDWRGRSGAAGVWREASHALFGVGGRQVQFRFALDTAAVGSAGDGVGIDDVRIELFAPDMVRGFPFATNFENGPSGFSAGGPLSSWALGAPVGVQIVGAASGTQAWVTTLDGPYPGQELSYLRFPRFDFRALPTGAADPRIEFAILHAVRFDRAYLEMALDGGSFVRVGDGRDGQNWYEDVNLRSWVGTSGPPGVWQAAWHPLTGAAGHVADLRLVTRSVVSSQPTEGIGIDDVVIRCAACAPIAHPGTDDDLLLRSDVGGVGLDRRDRKQVAPGQRFRVEVSSPDGSLAGLPWTLLFTPELAGAVVPFAPLPLPGCPCPGLYIGVETFVAASATLTSTGTEIGIVWPDIPGRSMLVQAVVLTQNGSSNPYFTATDGHVFEQR